MSKEIAGKIFSTPEEAGVTPPTEAELARARKLFDEFQQNSGTTFQVPSMNALKTANHDLWILCQPLKSFAAD
jgi:hypothetical protein